MDLNFIRAISPSRPGNLICISNVPSDAFFVVMMPVEARRLGLHLRGNDDDDEDDDDDDDVRCEGE
jgi:hypothetical protein